MNLFDLVEDFLAQLNFNRGNIAFELLQGCRANNVGGHKGPCRDKLQGHLRRVQLKTARNVEIFAYGFVRAWRFIALKSRKQLLARSLWQSPHFDIYR